MCFHASNTKTAVQVENAYQAVFKNKNAYQPNAHFSGFEFPRLPVITNQNMQEIQLYNWGLIPNWANDISIRQHTLNARLETIHEKASFKKITHNRCIILADGFYEWKWLDAKGKQKQQYHITLKDSSIFAFAGLFDKWLDAQTKTDYFTFTILTVEANDFMAEIHNHGRRMPVILTKQQELEWLMNDSDSIVNNDIELIARQIPSKGQNNTSLTLFD